MSRKKFFVKSIKNITELINNLLEKNLNKLNLKNLSFLLKSKKIILSFVALFVIFLSYLLLPTFYNITEVSKELKTEIQNKFDLNFKFSQNIKYNFFPRPHFIIADSIISDNEIEISKISKLKIFVSLDNLFTLKNIEVSDLIFENANFNLNKKNYIFFNQLLNTSFKDRSLTINNGNVFFRNLENEVLFINKILKMKYYYEPKESKNIFYSDNEIFNIPFSIKSFFNEDKSKIFSQINFNHVKFKIDNELNLRKKQKIGKSNLILKNLKLIAEYQVDKNSFNFKIFDKLDQRNVNYEGQLNFKPFYASLKGDLDKINLNHLFGSGAIIAQLLKTEIFNNENINFKLNLKAKNAFNNSNFRNIYINSKIQEGLIDTDKTKFEWRDFADFELFESLIYVKNGELVLDGKLKINVKDYNKFYTFFVTPKNYRNEIKLIDLNFTYNFEKKIAELNDIKIDNKININVNKILNKIIIKKDNLQNKIYFKNLLNKAIKSYAG